MYKVYPGEKLNPVTILFFSCMKGNKIINTTESDIFIVQKDLEYDPL